jgi:hypothetical protein
MKLDPARLVGPLLALLVLVLVLQQTVQALRTSGVWSHRHASARPASPFVPLERLLDPARSTAPPTSLRDPFAFGSTPTAAPKRPATRPAPITLPVERPQVTALVWSGGANPVAIIRWKGQSYTMREADTLPSGFIIKKITPDQVTLERGSETLVLPVPKKGD